MTTGKKKTYEIIAEDGINQQQQGMKKKSRIELSRSERHLVRTNCVVRLMCCLTNSIFVRRSHNVCNVTEKREQQAGRPAE